MDDYDSIRRELYRDSDVILICFDIGHPPSLQSVVNKVHNIELHLASLSKRCLVYNLPYKNAFEIRCNIKIHMNGLCQIAHIFQRFFLLLYTTGRSYAVGFLNGSALVILILVCRKFTCIENEKGSQTFHIDG